LQRKSFTVALTQTAKKTREHKAGIIQDVRSKIDEHDSLYVFSYENMRSSKFKKIRMEFRAPNMEGKRSRIFLGKNKLMQIALGRTEEDEYSENLRHVSKLITGNVGLLSTSKPSKEVEEYFANFAEDDYARAGAKATRQVNVNNEMLYKFPSSMVDQFRKMGLPVDVDNGKLVLVGNKKDHTVCEDGDELSAEDCKLLTHFGIKLTEFRVKLLCCWTAADGSFEKYE
jgi:mRNA turnover protein 4